MNPAAISQRFPKFVRLCTFVLATLAFAGLAAPRFDAPSRAECYDFMEVVMTLDAPGTGNPFTDASLSGEFGAEGALAQKVDGFCDAADGRVFRIRFEKFDWWKLDPHPECLSLPPEPERPAPKGKPDAAPPVPVLRAAPMCLAQVGERYLIYFPQGGSCTVNLAPGDYNCRWYNPRVGTFSGRVFGAPGGRYVSPPAPDAEDWALVIEKR